MSIKIEQQLFDSFKQFAELYRATVEKTGKKHMIMSMPTLSNMSNVPDIIEKQYQDEIAIKMSEDEYTRFIQNWGMYIDLMYVCRHNPIIREEFEKVMIMVRLLK